MSTGRKILMSIAVTVVFFLLLEGVLAIVGVRAESYADDPYVGFFQAVVSGADQRRGGSPFLSAKVGDFPRR